MNNTTLFALGAGVLLLPKVLGSLFQFRRVQKLLTKYPDAEQTSVFVPSGSVRPWRVWTDLGSKIEVDMKKQGWTFLRSSHVRDSRVTLSGVTLHFIRTKI